MAKANIPSLNETEIKQKLKEIPGWEYRDNKLAREFKFKDFNYSLNFIDSLAEIFEETDHHPDIHIYYSRVIFELNTHSAGNKVTEIDFIVAAEINRVYNDNER